MAIRYVLVRFSSNVSQFTTDMGRAAAANRALQQATQELAASETAAQAAQASFARSRAQYYGSLGPLRQREQQLVQAQTQGAQAVAAAAQTGSAQQVAAAQATSNAQIAAAQAAVDARVVATAQFQAAMVAEQTASTESADVVVANAEREAAAREAAAQASMASIRSMGKYMMIGGAIIAAGVFEATKSAMQFESAMAGAAAVSDLTRTHLAEMSKEVLGLSEVLPISADAFAKGLAEAEKAGYQGYNAISLLRAAAEGVVAGAGDEQKAVDSLARTMNGFGLGMADLNTVNNVLLANTRNGIGTYGDFAKAMADMAPIARANHVSFQDAAATLAVMSRRSLDASASGMALTRMMYALTREAQPAEKKLVDLYNAQHNLKVSSGEAVFAAVGLSGVVKMIGDATAGEASQISSFFTNIRMAKGANALFEDSGKAVIDMMRQYQDATKLATDAAIQFEQQQKTAANQVKIAHNEIKAAEISFGQAFLPTVGAVAKAVGELADWFAHLSPGVQKAMIITGAFVGVLMLMGGAFLMLAPGVAALAESMVALAAGETGAAAGALGLMATLAPLLLVAAPLMAIGAAFMIAGMHAAQGRQAVERWTNALKEEQSGTADATSTMLTHELAHQKVLQVLDKYGVTLPQVTDIVKNGRKDFQNFTDVLNTLTRTTGLSTEELKKQGLSDQQIAEIHGHLAGALNGSSKEFHKLKEETQNYGVSSEEAMHVVSTLSHENQRATQAARDLEKQNRALVESSQANNRSLLDTGRFTSDATDEMKRLSDTEKDVQQAIKNMVGAQKVLQDAMEDTKQQAKGFADATDVFKEGLKSYDDAVEKSAQKQYDAYKKGIEKQVQALQDQATSANQSISDQVSAYKTLGNASKINGFIVGQSGKDAARDVTKSTQDQIRALQDNEKSLQDFKDAAKKSAGGFGTSKKDMEDWLTSLEKTGKDTKKWNENLIQIAARGGSKELVQQLREMGKDAIPIVAQFSKATSAEISKANDAVASLTPNAKVSFTTFAATLHTHVTDMLAFKNNILALEAKDVGGQHMTDLANYLIKSGPDAAQAVADALKMSPQQLAEANADAKTAADAQSDEYVKAWSLQLDVLQEVGAQAGSTAGAVTLKSLADALRPTGLGEEEIRSALEGVQGIFDSVSPKLRFTLVPELKGIPPQAPTPSQAQRIGNMTPAQVRQMDPRRREMALSESHGGVVSFYQFGGEDHTAQIAPAGDYRVWAERETGGEAYIPLGMDRRHRSVAVLRDVASRFGYSLASSAAPAGSMMTGGGGAAQAPSVVVVKATQPVSHETTWQFNGPIQGYKLEDVQRDADRKRRVAALVGRRRG